MSLNILIVIKVMGMYVMWKIIAVIVTDKADTSNKTESGDATADREPEQRLMIMLILIKKNKITHLYFVALNYIYLDEPSIVETREPSFSWTIYTLPFSEITKSSPIFVV